MEHKMCPRCYQSINANEDICPHCQFNFSDWSNNTKQDSNNIISSCFLVFGLGIMTFLISLVVYIKELLTEDIHISTVVFLLVSIILLIVGIIKIKEFFKYKNHPKLLMQKNKQKEEAESFINQEISKRTSSTRNINAELHCPKCGSKHIATINRGYSIITGFIGSGSPRNVCQICGHKWKP